MTVRFRDSRLSTQSGSYRFQEEVKRLPDGLFGDSNVRIGHMYPVRLYVIQAAVRINTGCPLVSMKLSRLERSPRCVLLREIFARLIRREAENATWASEDMYLHILLL
jgi:hypothetical protein